jgi:hypothetical protein
VTNQAQQSRPISSPVLLAHRAGRSQIYPQVFGHVMRHALVDLSHDSKAGIVKGVVQINQPEARRLIAHARFSSRTSQASLVPLVRTNHGAHTLAGQDLQQQAVGYTAIDDVNRLDAAPGGIQGGADLG